MPHLVRQQNCEHGPHVQQPFCQCAAITLGMSLMEYDCGRQPAAPTQSVEKHVATNSTSGNANRRRDRAKMRFSQFRKVRPLATDRSGHQTLTLPQL